LLVTALRQGRKPAFTLHRLKSFFGLWPSTIKRWLRYFQGLFIQSDTYRRLCGYLMPPIGRDVFLRDLLQRFYQQRCDAQTALIDCLCALAMGP
jgi:hypothetical protein